LRRIAVNAVLHRPNRGGVEVCIEGLVRGFSEAGLNFEVHVFASDSLVPPATDRGLGSSGLIWHSISYSTRLERIAREQILALRHRSFSLWHCLGYLMPWFPPRGKRVVSIYDIIALTNPSLCTRANRAFFGLMLPRTIRNADCIVVPSHYVKERVEERFPEAEGRLRVVPLPLRSAITAARGSPPEGRPVHQADADGTGYLLYVGDLGPRKNIGFLLRAYAALPDTLRSRYRLKICGRTGEHRRRYERLAQELGILGQVDFGGYVPDGDLPACYRSARLLLHPSLEEGYGLPPLEAMALGTPAVVSDRGALPEVAGTAGAIVSPLNVEEFSQVICRMLTDGRAYRQATAQGREGVPRTTWADYAREMGRIYAELV